MSRMDATRDKVIQKTIATLGTIEKSLDCLIAMPLKVLDMINLFLYGGLFGILVFFSNPAGYFKKLYSTARRKKR